MTGKEVKEARTRLNMLQITLAKEVGVSVTSVRNWERGEFEISAGNAKKIIALLRKYTLEGQAFKLIDDTYPYKRLYQNKNMIYQGKVCIYTILVEKDSYEFYPTVTKLENGQMGVVNTRVEKNLIIAINNEMESIRNGEKFNKNIFEL